MSLDLNALAVSTLVGIALAFTGGAIGMHLKNRLSGLGIGDNLHVMSYLTRYDAALEYHGLGGRERRANIYELKSNLAESAADGGVAAALDRLGPPRKLAAEVAGSRLVPSWSRGALWVAGAIMIGLFALVMSASAFSAALPADASATWSPFLWTMSGSSEAGGSAFELQVPFTTPLLLLVPFLVGARVWRLWARQSPWSS